MASIYGTNGSDIRNGGEEGDFIFGGPEGGDPTLELGDDQLNGHGGNDVVHGLGGSDTLNGGDSDDHLYGGNGDDLIDGDAGFDYVEGGAGDDTLYGGWHDTLYGGTGRDVIYAEGARAYGGDGDDTLNGAPGGSFLFGEGGSDVIYADTAVAYGGDGNDTLNGGPRGSGLHGEAGSDLIEGGDGSDSISDDAQHHFADSLRGGAGDDYIRTIGGQDTIDAGAGDDTVDISRRAATGELTFIMTSTSTITTLIGDGTTVVNAETINISTGAFNDTLATLSGNDYLNGEDGDDSLDGGGGDDGLHGGAGDDALDGGDGDDGLDGGSGTNTLDGGAGDDFFGNSVGDDRFDGGTGIDTVRFWAGSVSVYVNLQLTGPQNTGASGTDTLISVENIIGGSGGDTLTGNAAANRIEGGNGNDRMTGLAGNDVYIVDRVTDIVVEAAGQGIDRIETDVISFSLYDIANVENLTFTGAADFVGRGNSLDNRIAGGLGDDRFVADQGGADRYFGDFGFDTMDFRTSALGATINVATGVHGGAAAGDFFSSIEYFYGSDAAGDSLTGAAFNDHLFGYAGNDTLSGLGGNDYLYGGEGNDEISGGTLLDFLYGENGADDFNYADVSDSGPTSGARDRIFGFAAGSDDIDVSLIDASKTAGGNNAFTGFFGAAAFTAEGQVRWFQSGANTVIEFNTTGTTGAEMQIQLQNFTASNLTAGDFIA
jgi:Ca2+-binding RTX toxin-like protein